MMQKEEQKVGLSTMNIVLSVFGIIFFSMFIILPPIFRLVFKEDAPIIPPVVDPVEVSFSCFMETEDTEGYKSYQYTIRGLGDLLDTIAYTENFKYQVLPENASWECETLNNTYGGLTGMYYNCRILENDKTIDTRITVSTYQGSVPMVLENYQGETLTTYYTKLVNSGFTCNEIQ